MWYEPTKFMLSTSHYDKAKADRIVKFFNLLRHTKGKWAGKPFDLMEWQERALRDVYGIVKEDGNRQFKNVYIEIPKKNGKSELAAGIADYQLIADHEASPEVYGAACDRKQAGIVFDVARRMIQMEPELNKRCKPVLSQKRIVCYDNWGIYEALSSETCTKEGLNVSSLIFDEVHAQKDRKLYDVLTQGSGDAREQPLFFFITTAGNNRESICYELHCKARDILDGKKQDPTFYPVIYGLEDGDDWHDEKKWYQANPSLGKTIKIESVREHYQRALDNPAEENKFKQLRLNMWVSSTVAWIPEHVFDKGNKKIDLESLKGRECYGGLDLSSTSDITAFVLVFPPRNESEKYVVLPNFWLPKDQIDIRVRHDHVMYDKWAAQGLFNLTNGNVIDYLAVQKKIEELNTIYHIKEIAFDRWGAVQMSQNLEGAGFEVVQFGQGYASMSPPSKEFYKLLQEGKIIHGGNPVLRWMAGNAVVEQDAAENIKPNKKKSTEKIDGIVALIMALDRCIRHKQEEASVYDERGLVVL